MLQSKQNLDVVQKVPRPFVRLHLVELVDSDQQLVFAADPLDELSILRDHLWETHRLHSQCHRPIHDALESKGCKLEPTRPAGRVSLLESNCQVVSACELQQAVVSL